MFWGMKIHGPKSHVAFMSEEAIRICNISLEPTETGGSKSYIKFYIVSKSGQEFLVAQLRNPDRLNAAIDLDIDPDDDIMLRVKGEGTVHLAGYILTDDEDSSVSEEEDPSVSEEEDSSVSEEEDSTCHEAAKHLSGLRLASTQTGMTPPNFG